MPTVVAPILAAQTLFSQAVAARFLRPSGSSAGSSSWYASRCSKLATVGHGTFSHEATRLSAMRERASYQRALGGCLFAALCSGPSGSWPSPVQCEAIFFAPCSAASKCACRRQVRLYLQ